MRFCSARSILIRQKYYLTISTIILILINFLVVRINVYVNSIYPFFHKLSGYDLSFTILNDMMEKYLNIPILLLAIFGIIRKYNTSERVRFKSRKIICKYYLLQMILFCLIFSFLTVASTMIFSHIFMQEKRLLWTETNNFLYLILGDEYTGKTIMAWHNPFSVAAVFFISMFLRNISISIAFMLLNLFLKKEFSFLAVFSMVIGIYMSENILSMIYSFSFSDFSSISVYSSKIITMISISVILIVLYENIFINKDYVNERR